MSAVLVVEGSCGACEDLGRALVAAGVEVECLPAAPERLRDGAAEGGGRLPVLVAPDGSVAAGVAAAALARRLGADVANDHGHAPEPVPPPPAHPGLGDLERLVGTWSGEGAGHYPTISPFAYRETVVFSQGGKPLLAYRQTSQRLDDGTALHTEVGYLRPAGPNRVEVLIAQPTGIVEVDEGSVTATADGALEIRLASTSIGVASAAKEVTAVERTFRLVGDELRITLAMAAVGLPLTPHLSSVLRRETA